MNLLHRPVESTGFRRQFDWLQIRYAGQLVLLMGAIRSIPLGICYAAFTGLGATGTALVGIAAYAEPITLVRCACLTVIVVAVMALKHSSPQSYELCGSAHSLRL